MIRDIKTGHLYFLRNGNIICIDRMKQDEMFFTDNMEDKNHFLSYNVYTEDNIPEACKNEFILLTNAKLQGKLLYLNAKEIRFLKLAEIKAPFLINGNHVRVQENIFDYQESLARQYNEELVEELTQKDEIEYQYSHQKRANHFWNRKKP